MGKLAYAIGKGRSTAGAELGTYVDAQTEQERYDEQAKIRKEAHEASLRAMDIRNEQLRLSNNLKKVELNNKRITTIFTQTEGDPAAVSKAITQYGNGHAERYLEAESREATKQNGYETIVTENGVFETNEEGAVTPGKDGKPIFKRFSGGAGVITRTRPEYNDHVGRVLNPSNALAQISSNQTYKDIYAKAEAKYKAKEESDKRTANTPDAKAKRELVKAQTGLANKRAANVGVPKPDKPKPAATTIKDIRGKDVERTHTEAQGDLAAMKIVAKNHPDWGVTSPDQAYRINELKNSKDLRNAMADDIQRAITPGEEKFAEKFIKQGAMKMGVPEAMLREMVEQASQNAETIQSSKGGLMNWLKDFFGGGGAKAPAIYKDEKPGGLS